MQDKTIVYPDYLYQITVGTIFTAYALYGYYIFLPILGLNEEGFFATTIFVFSFVPVFFFVKFTTEVLNGEFRKKRADKYIALKEEVAKLKAKGKYYPKSKYYLRVGWMLALLVLFVSITGLNAGMQGNEFFGILFGAIPALFMINFLYKKVLSGEDYRETLKTRSKKAKAKTSSQAVEEGEAIMKKEDAIEPLMDEDGDIMLDNEKLAELGSYPNLENQETGHRWSSSKEVFEKSKGKDFYLDNFAFSAEVLREIGEDNEEDIGILENVESRTDPLSLTKTFSLVGSTGGGKTVTMESFLLQEHFSRAVIHDSKGDFLQKFYREDKDIILNYYDERSHVWDFIAEADHNPIIVEAFVKNLVEASSGDDAKADFFSGNSTMLIAEAIDDVRYSDSPREDRWKNLISGLRGRLDSMLGDGDKTDGSIAKTMRLTINIFELMEHRVSKGAKLFTLHDFVHNKEKKKLFLLNNDAYSSALTPFFVGFLGVFSALILTKKETKEDFTLALLDEFLSLRFNKETKKDILTRGRSKGLQTVLGLQYLEEGKDEQVVDSSKFVTMIFRIGDEKSRSKTIKAVGEVEWKESVLNYSRDFGNSRNPLSDGKKYSRSTQHRKRNFLRVDMINSLPKHHHFTLIPEENLYYLGKSRYVELEEIHEPFISIDIDEFKREQYLRRKGKKVEMVCQTATDPLANASEEDLFVHWMNLNFADSDESLNRYLSTHSLNQAHIDKIFDPLDEATKKNEESKEDYSDNEWEKMIDEFFSLEDTKQRYRYAKEKKILGAITAFYASDTKFDSNKAQEALEDGTN